MWLALSRGYGASFVFALTAWAGLIAAGVYALNALIGDRVERRVSILVGAIVLPAAGSASTTCTALRPWSRCKSS